MTRVVRRGPALTPEQRHAADEIRRWYEDGARREITLGGLAGTGKTTMARQLPRELGLGPEQVAYCAFTGKAAAVLNCRLAGQQATTIHRLIYTPVEVHCLRCPRLVNEEAKCHSKACPGCYLEWERALSLDPALELIIVDEASMVTETIHADLIGYGVPIIWIGDHGQLPPVKSVFNLMESPDLRLETIHRQVAESPILQLATLARRTGEIPFGEFSDGVLKRRHDGSFDVDDVDDWSSDLLVLCGRNRSRVQLNRAVRLVRGFPSDEPVNGDRVICLPNNREAGIYNGMTGTLSEVRRRDGAYYLTVELDGGGGYSGRAVPEQFNSETTLGDTPRSFDLWDFGYCLTVHKAQGSEAERVILLEERIGPRVQHRRWLYTGITRAKRALEIIA